MDLSRAKEILQILAGGTDPFSGGPLPDDDSCSQPDTILALCIVLGTLDGRPAVATAATIRAWRSWTTQDDALLAQMYRAGDAPEEICARLGRSRSAVAARLMRLGQICRRSGS